ncbi:MAG: tRNA pseudouridine(38-40) synthase TruA [Janthinobacterium lividum]
MPRYKITIEYDGTPFVGWQWQANGMSIQQVLQQALEKFIRAPVLVEGAGRTDAGVHACGQVAHFDLNYAHDPLKIMSALNFFMRPHSVAIINCLQVSEEFHARFSARWRRYRYVILNRKAPPVLEQNRVWWVPKSLNAQKMHEAAQLLIGQHDFTTFRATSCQAASAMKTIDFCQVTQHDTQIWLDIQARSFLHHQVRNIMGALKWVGEGKWNLDDLQTALDTRLRSAGGPTAPAAGLYFIDVGYEEEYKNYS